MIEQSGDDKNSINRIPADLNHENLSGMNTAQAKEYIFGFVATLKMTEKEITAAVSEAAKWMERARLARERGAADLLTHAEQELQKAAARHAALQEEALLLRKQIDSMRRQLPGLAARERSVDPDILEQELLLALGQSQDEVKADKAFRELEKENAAATALEELKAKMRK
ncbi:MAG: chromosome partitioning protein [Treponema sp.]|jgi:phage shock protein A|nr:chromosome partitioning protein [Treponema sp.]